jgi:hypothetical protein
MNTLSHQHKGAGRCGRFDIEQAHAVSEFLPQLRVLITGLLDTEEESNGL